MSKFSVGDRVRCTQLTDTEPEDGDVKVYKTNDEGWNIVMDESTGRLIGAVGTVVETWPQGGPFDCAVRFDHMGNGYESLSMIDDDLAWANVS